MMESNRFNLAMLCDLICTGFSSFENFLSSIEVYKPSVRDAVLMHAASNPASDDSPRLVGFVIDTFCTSMIDVANEFGVPSYLFYTSSATMLGATFYLQAQPDAHWDKISTLIESDGTIDYPGLANPFPVKLLPDSFLEKDGCYLSCCLAKRYKETKGIIVNTFEELDTRAIEHVFDDKLPPLYPVGPLLNLRGRVDKAGSEDILKWLDGQPPASVVFLCFGSMGSFGKDQVGHIADALEKTGHRFLWSLRRPPAAKYEFPSSYENPEEVLPEGFLDRTAGKGKVIGLAPQAQVLAHPAIGGFVSHCGWNSILESLWFGVPLAAWPMYAEQHFNAFALVEELGIAVELSTDYGRDFKTGNERVIPAEEIERGIMRLMGNESEGRKQKVKQLSERSRKAVMEGGSSHMNLGRFIEDVYSNICRS